MSHTVQENLKKEVPIIYHLYQLLKVHTFVQKGFFYHEFGNLNYKVAKEREYVKNFCDAMKDMADWDKSLLKMDHEENEKESINELLSREFEIIEQWNEFYKKTNDTIGHKVLKKVNLF